MSASAFIVRIPEAEPYVKHFRERFDPVANLGVPAHITLLYPFMPRDSIDASVIAEIASTVVAIQIFSFRLKDVRHFPDAIYLAPEPATPFIDLTWKLADRFPAFPPYGGAHDTVIPHLTVARRPSADLAAIDSELSAAIASQGAVESMCTTVDLIENSSGRWEPFHKFYLSER